MTMRCLTLCLSLLIPGLGAHAATPGTSFTYQGRLNTDGAPAAGRFDLQFSLYDAATNGTLVAGPQSLAAVGISNGLFSVTLDFGSVFDGNSRWLEIAARPNGVGTYTTLLPRQLLSATPYASFATLAGGVSSGGITSTMLADGAVTSAKIGAGAVKPSNIDDAGAAAYEEMIAAGRGLRTFDPLPFSDLSLVASNTGAAAALTFRLNGAAFGTVQGFSGHEGLSEVYEYVVEVIASRAEVDPDSAVGRTGALTFSRNSRSTVFGGVVTACTMASSKGNSLFTFRIQPALALMRLRSNYRIFQGITVPDLASQLYEEINTNGLTASLFGSYSARPVTTQFAETDLDFFSRLLEHEGIFYFFRMDQAVPKLILGDVSGAFLPSSYDAVRYYGNSPTNPRPNEECLRAFQRATRESIQAANLNGYDFQFPRKVLLAREATGAGRGETYEFDATTTDVFEMRELAAVRLQSQQAERNLISGAGNAPDLRPGYTFTVDDQSGTGVSGSFVATGVRHAAFRRTVNGITSFYYGNQFQAIPAATPYRPARKTPRPFVPACTAVVTGRAGEEIWTDKYGRVKVKFHWDRSGANDETSSAWVRVATHWAGKTWGSLTIPRVGQEVLVEFINGDPDQPVIAGSFYNGENMPPYALPGNATQSGVRTQSSKAGSTAGYNEIRFEDKQGYEQVYIRGQKDLLLEVINDTTFSTGHDLEWTVANDWTVQVNHHLNIAAANGILLSSPQGVGINTANDPAFALKVGGVVSAAAFQGNAAGLTNVSAGAVTTGTIQDGRLSGNVALLGGSQTFTGAKTFTSSANVFNGIGSGLSGVNADQLDGQHGSFYLNASNLNAGTLSDARLSYNIPRLDGSQSFGGNNTFLGRMSVGGPMGLDTLNVFGSARLNDYDLFFRPGDDLNHGLGWYGAGKLFSGANIDGPVLYGCDGGGLGTACGVQKLALRWNANGNVIIDPNNQNTGALLPGLTFGSSGTEGIASKRNTGGNVGGLDLYTSNQVRVAISQNGNVGIGQANPSVRLDVAGGIRATGAIRVGSETGTGQFANYPAGSEGLVIRRASSTVSTVGSVVARTDKLILERDGSIAGLRISYPAAPGKQTIHCIGISTNGTQVVFRQALNNPATAGSLTLFADAQKITHYDISFGNTFNAGHTTRVVLDRYDDGATSDNFLVGTLTSTFNQ